MKFIKKTNKLKSFMVEDYNDTQKEFFIGLGFTERIVKGFCDEIASKCLIYRGSGFFGFWSDEEIKTIHKATKKQFGNFKVRTLTTAELM